ncbi:hypothetical protein pb186bvf_017122 [Paramecium bursaria]
MFFILLFNLVFADNFGLELQTNEKKCLFDSLPKGTIITLQIVANSTEFEFEFQLGQKTIETMRKEILIRYSKALSESERIGICLNVFGSKPINFLFTYKTGSDTDHSQVASKGDLSDIETQVNQLDRQVTQIKTMKPYIYEFQMSISEQINGYSLLTLGLTCITTIIIVQSLKMMLKRKKVV